MSVVVALQKALRSRLVGAAGVTNLVPASGILDRNAVPAPDPSIVLGEHQILPGEDLARHQLRVFSTLHIWKREPSLAGVQAIAGEVRLAILQGPLQLDAGYHCGDCKVADMRFLRDPDGETSHAVLTVDTLIAETG